MEATELMLGDWVMLTDPIHDGEKVQVRAIHADGYIGIDGGLTRESFKPIPITAEILERNGFKECTNGEWTNNNVDFILYKRKDGVFRIQNTNMTLPWVSSLQHALRLCNIEKTIEL